jgi:ABC-type transporter Mla maintaining outer membrane lipid asymmetry permease subunit MlaE
MLAHQRTHCQDQLRRALATAAALAARRRLVQHRNVLLAQHHAVAVVKGIVVVVVVVVGIVVAVAVYYCYSLFVAAALVATLVSRDPVLKSAVSTASVVLFYVPLPTVPDQDTIVPSSAVQAIRRRSQ